ncbi:hypothetical protein D9613_012502 [Agrocybe pediades]|uniref:Fork-head domain-containing protein n=1 Tax=Agrocybe pediades TaxID=84607 RepID=A0A8H4VPV7_9AGAR|nr:hypothetical protein D9613_012502 [Agrocybe pediades]
MPRVPSTLSGKRTNGVPRKVPNPEKRRRMLPKKTDYYKKEMRRTLEAQGTTDWDFTSLSDKVEAHIRKTLFELKYPIPSYSEPLDLRSLPDGYDHDRPNYLVLILLAIWGSAEKRLKLHEIYEAIEGRFGLGCMNDASRGSLRHKLSYEKEFFYNLQPLSRPSTDRNRGNKRRRGQVGHGEPWIINPLYISSLDPESLKDFYPPPSPPLLLYEGSMLLYIDGESPFTESSGLDSFLHHEESSHIHDGLSLCQLLHPPCGYTHPELNPPYPCDSRTHRYQFL